MSRYVCVHGHFYQPPRENPWLESVERQPGAHPYHDWNQRISAECYSPNAASRILTADERIRAIVNNYERISFNFGPTLLSWLELHAPELYAAILDADKRSQARFGGHGSALAQAYNHVIMPLATRRDKWTQLVWGVRDFEHRFGRSPEGLWLPETAVDGETLELMVELGLRFTVLAPRQAGRTRPLSGGSWQACGEAVNTRRPYLVRLSGGRELSVFFYDGAVARGVAFEGLLRDGASFAGRLLDGFSAELGDDPQLVHIATDGESYGHHHRHGDMALAWALDHIEASGQARLTNYAEFLELRPPRDEVELVERSSWSCAHGVERWRADCGCATGGQPHWTQAWRAPLREALELLSEQLIAPRFERAAAPLLSDPWRARDEFIAVVLDRSESSVDAFLEREATHELGPDERVQALRLLELERMTMLSFTSCGWFFDELSGIETVQLLRYAGRALQLAAECFGERLDVAFLEQLSLARSNLPERGDGRELFERQVRPLRVDLLEVGAHFAVSSVFESYRPRERLHCYDVARLDQRVLEAGRMRLVLGRARIASTLTRASADVSYGAFHLGDHNLNAGVRLFAGEAAYAAMLEELGASFGAGDVAETIRGLDRHFGASSYSLRSLFKDEQERILEALLRSSREQAEGVYQRLYDQHAALMQFVGGLGTALPRVFGVTAELVINLKLRQALEAEELNPEPVARYLADAERDAIPLDEAALALTLERRLERLMDAVARTPDDHELMARLERGLEVSERVPFEVDLWRVQNGCYALRRRLSQELGRAPRSASSERLDRLAERLRLVI